MKCTDTIVWPITGKKRWNSQGITGVSLFYYSASDLRHYTQTVIYDKSRLNSLLCSDLSEGEVTEVSRSRRD